MAKTTRIIYDAERKIEVQVVATPHPGVATIKRLRDAGATNRSCYDPLPFGRLNWKLTRRGDYANILFSKLEERTISKVTR